MHKRILTSDGSAGELRSTEACPIVHDGDHVAGNLIIRQKPGSSLEHSGVYIELRGAVERHGKADGVMSGEDFSVSKGQLLAAMSEPLMRETIMLEFDFGNARFPFESYDGTAVFLR